MKTSNLFYLGLCLLFNTTISSAQSIKLNPDEFAFPILDTALCRVGDCIVSINIGSESVLKLSNKGYYLKPNLNNHNSLYLAGNVELSEQNQEDSKFKVDFLSKDSITNKDDFIVLKADIPKNQYRSIFFEMCRANIRLLIRDTTNAVDDYFYSFQDLWDKDTPAKENKYIELVLRDIQKHALEYLKEEEENYQIQSGFYAGETIPEAINKFNKLDLMRLCNFLKENETHLWGNSIPASLIAFLWLREGAPLADSELWEMLRATKNAKELRNLMADHNQDILIKTKKALDNAIAYAEKDEIATAKSMLQELEEIITLLDKPSIHWKKAFLLSTIAQSEGEDDFFFQQHQEMYRITKNHAVDTVRIIEKAVQLYELAISRDKLQVALEALLDLENYSTNDQTGEAICQALIDVYQKLNQPEKIDEYKYKQIKFLEKQKGLNSLLQITRLYFELSDYEPLIASANRLYDLALEEKNKSYQALGLAYGGWGNLREDNYEGAIQKFQESTVLARQSNEQGIISFCLNQLATIYKQTGKPHKAINTYLELLDINQKNKDVAYVIHTRYNLAEVYTQIKEYDEAIRYLKIIENWASENKDTLEITRIKTNLYSVYWDKKEYATAKIIIEDLLSLQKKLNDREAISYSLANLASLHLFFEINYELANSYLDEVIQLAQQEPPLERALAMCYQRKAELYTEIGKPGLRREYNEKALKIYRELKDKLQEGYCLMSLADINNFDRALVYYEQAQKIGEEIADKNLVASARWNIANVNALQAKFDEALQLFNQNLEDYQKTDNLWGLAHTYLEIANVYVTNSNYQQAEKFILRADSLYESMGLVNQKINIYQTLGRLYYYQGDYEKSYTNHLKSFTIRDSLGMRDGGFEIAALNVGDCLYSLKKLEESEKYVRIGLENAIQRISEYEQSSANRLLGHIRVAQGKYQESLTFYEKAIPYNLKNNEREHLIQVYLGQCRAYFGLKQDDKANKLANKTIQLSEEISTHFWDWEAHYILGKIYRRAGNYKKSQEHLSKAIEMIEALRSKISGGDDARQIFSAEEKKVEVYEAIIDLFIQTNQLDQALEYLEKNNQGDLQKKFKDLKIQFENPEKNKLLQEGKILKQKEELLEKQLSQEQKKPQEKQNIQKIENLQRQINIASKDYRNFIDEKVNNNPELRKYFGATGSINLITFRKKRESIPEDMAMVYYLPGETQLYIFVATKDSVNAKVVPYASHELKKLITYIQNTARFHYGYRREALSIENEKLEREAAKQVSPHLSNFQKVSESLYTYLIEPIHEDIRQKSKLVIVPNGDLYFLPFQLVGKSLPNGKFSLLIEQFAILYTSSLDMLDNLSSVDASELNIIAFGNPDLSLPSSEKEVAKIKNLYPLSKIYIRQEATEDKAKDPAEGFNVMHFATHGNLDYKNFKSSYLTMAQNPQEGEDGKLTLNELFGLELMTHLDLVVLSACQTAIIDENAIGSPVSPASGFVDNGVKSVIASLWSVDDRSTSLLISYFYENLKTMPKIDALRLAQIKLSQNPDYNHPYYWAPFILIGDWK